MPNGTKFVPPNPGRPGRENEAFTLIELLVVIAIIAVLAGMLLPALSKAKQRTLQTQCTGNQKQLMLATILYEGDANDYVPHPNWDFDPNVPGWLCRPPFVQSQTNIKTGVLWTYAPSYKIYRCPMDNTNTAQFRSRAQQNTSYIMNGALCAYSTSMKKTFKVSQFPKVDAIIMWQANEKSPGDFNDASSTPNEGISAIHNKGTTVGCIGGSVEYIKLLNFYKEVNVKPGRLWCVPGSPTGGG